MHFYRNDPTKRLFFQSAEDKRKTNNNTINYQFCRIFAISTQIENSIKEDNATSKCPT